RVQGEDDVDQRDLQDEAHEAGFGGATTFMAALLAYDAVPDFQGALEQQEQAAEEQDQIASRDTLAPDGEQVIGQAHDPGDREQQQDARTHRQRQAKEARPGLLMLGQTRDQVGDEDDVVDAQNDFQGGQGQVSHPEFWVGEPFQNESGPALESDHFSDAPAM